jgi:hypothetical protein
MDKDFVTFLKKYLYRRGTIMIIWLAQIPLLQPMYLIHLLDKVSLFHVLRVDKRKQYCHVFLDTPLLAARSWALISKVPIYFVRARSTVHNSIGLPIHTSRICFYTCASYNTWRNIVQIHVPVVKMNNISNIFSPTPWKMCANDDVCSSLNVLNVNPFSYSMSRQVRIQLHLLIKILPAQITLEWLFRPMQSHVHFQVGFCREMFSALWADKFSSVTDHVTSVRIATWRNHLTEFTDDQFSPREVCP